VTVSCSGRGPDQFEALQGSCSWLIADVQVILQLHFPVQYNGGFTIVKLHLNRVLEKQPLSQDCKAPFLATNLCSNKGGCQVQDFFVSFLGFEDPTQSLD